MRHWSRAVCEELCGYCQQVIYVGQPVQEIRVTGITRTMRRCMTCAEGPVPPDLPATHVPSARTKPMVPIRSLAGLPLDWKQRAAGEAQARQVFKEVEP